mmetsp:Transcript_4913/g.14241  ORF Transcript_4913/g.14241 Transcript_4913/m.14241 type:complete len:357 (-) Transcript_4913:2717-3787(-)
MTRVSTGASCSSFTLPSPRLDAMLSVACRPNPRRSPVWHFSHTPSRSHNLSRVCAAREANAWARTGILPEMRVDASNERLLDDKHARLFSDHAGHPMGAVDDSHEPRDHDWVTRSFDLLATKFVDESVLNVASMVNMNREQEYSQIVLIGDGTCTRFCRLPWPQGTVIFLVAPAEVHERAEAIIETCGEKAVAPRGCLLRRVDCDLSGDQAPNGLVAALEAKGFRGNRLSVFGLQGLRAMNVSRAAFEWIFSEISDAAAFESVVLGEIKVGSAEEMESLVAGYGMQGNGVSLEAVRDQCVPAVGADPRWMAALGANMDWRLFRATQRRLSLEEMDTLASHSAAAEAVDEDFFGNFS